MFTTSIHNHSWVSIIHIIKPAHKIVLCIQFKYVQNPWHKSRFTWRPNSMRLQEIVCTRTFYIEFRTNCHWLGSSGARYLTTDNGDDAYIALTMFSSWFCTPQKSLRWRPFSWVFKGLDEWANGWPGWAICMYVIIMVGVKVVS